MLVFRYVCLDGVGECNYVSLPGSSCFDVVNQLLEEFSGFSGRLLGSRCGLFRDIGAGGCWLVSLLL